jgi:hypothetical protein
MDGDAAAQMGFARLRNQSRTHLPAGRQSKRKADDKQPCVEESVSKGAAREIFRREARVHDPVCILLT